MQLGIFAKTFARPTLEETLDAVADLGLTQLQFNMSCAGLPTLPERLDEDLCVWIARLIKERGMTMAAISGTFNLCDRDESRLEDNLERLDVLAGACRWLDTRIITLCTGTRNLNDMWKNHPDNVGRSAWATLLESVSEAVEIADRHEVTLAFEPEIHNVVSSAMRARKLLDEIDSPWLKVVIDPSNLFRTGEVRPLPELLREAFDWLGPDIVLAHVKLPGWDERARPWLSEFFGRRHRRICEFMAASSHDVEDGEKAGPSRELAIHLWSFLSYYRVRLEEIDYNGAVVMHGVPEAGVAAAAKFIGDAMDPPAHREEWS